MQAVLSRLDSLQDICRAQVVCKQWGACVASAALWPELRHVKLEDRGRVPPPLLLRFGAILQLCVVWRLTAVPAANIWL